MASPAPPWLRHTADLDDADRWAALTPEERLRSFVELCELARTILTGRSDARAVLAATEPMPPQAEVEWRRLVREARRGRSPR